MKYLENDFAAHLQDNARMWCELDEGCPPGLFIASHPAGTRFWIFTHKHGGRRIPVAIQLDACPNRPAFSFTVLSEPTGIVGIWLGPARVKLRREANKISFPGRSGPVRVRGRRFLIRCTGPNGDAMSLNNQEEIRLRWFEQSDAWSHNYEEYSLWALQADGTGMSVYSSPKGPIERVRYLPLPGMASCMHNGWVNFSRYVYE